jgi:hypothetical protein
MRGARTHAFPSTAALAVTALVLGACGNLDNVTTVHDLRVLAVRSDPAGFLVPLDAPSSLTDTTATLTALVVDPQQPSNIITFTGEACPDYIDTVTSASGKSSKLCPSRADTDQLANQLANQLPAPLNMQVAPELGMVLATTELPAGIAAPVNTSTIEYNPKVTYGLDATKLGLFFSPTSFGAPTIDQAIQNNRDFGIDALVNLTFNLGTESASALKRVVYWPLLPPALVPPNTACSGVQAPNQNPDLQDVAFFRHRVDGIPADAYDPSIPPTLSLATDQLFVQPTFNEFAAENYLLRVKNAQTQMVETQCRKELLTFQFFTTAGTFSPRERTSQLSPLFTTPANGHIPIDAQWNPPSADKIPPDGKVTIWIVARDERAGASWLSRTLMLTP